MLMLILVFGFEVLMLMRMLIVILVFIRDVYLDGDLNVDCWMGGVFGFGVGC